MACFYTLRLPAAPGVTAERLFAELAHWLAADCGHDFPEITSHELSAPLEISTPSAQLSAVRSVMRDTVYTALRLQSDAYLSPTLPCPANMRSAAEFLLEERAEGCWFTLRLYGVPLTAGRTVTVLPLTMPDILWKLASKGFLQDDSGFPLQNTPLTNPTLLETPLKQLRSGMTFTQRPLLLVREGNYGLTPAIATRLCQCLHVLVLPGIHPALSGLGAGSARILFNRFGVSRSVDLTVPAACEDIVEYAARLTTLAVPVEPPSFALLRELCGNQTPPAADYLCLNPRMADAIRFYRLKSGLTQNDLAKKVGATGLLISRLENCRPARVRESLIAAIEDALHLKNREIMACEGFSAQEGPITTKPAYCPFCGTKTAETGDFCTGCGIKLI